MAETKGRQWVLLAAGSKDWVDYEDQADVCHAYQMVHSGIPDEQTVVMMYDDIASNAKNPYPGEIINEPNGPNVYPGVLKDYTGDDVTASNFLAVLRGDEAGVNKQGEGPVKVLNSKENDTIFVFLAGHGGKGLFAFPNDYLYAFDLLCTINEMSRCRQFSKMVIYIESCFSGSMIEYLPRDTQVYGVSACTPYEYHYACFYDEDRNAFLTSVFGAFWLFHCKTFDLTSPTFQQQFDFFRQQMRDTGCTPCQYGNSELSSLFISDLLVGCHLIPLSRLAEHAAHRGDPEGLYGPERLTGDSSDSSTQKKLAEPTASSSDSSTQKKLAELITGKSKTLSHEVPLVIHQKRIQRENDPERRKALQKDYDKLVETRAEIEKAMHEIAERSCPERGLQALKESRPLTRLHDVKDVAEHFRRTFSEWHEQDVSFILLQMQVFVNLFESGVRVARIKEAITHVRSLQKLL